MVKREAELTRQFNEHMKGGTGTVEVIRVLDAGEYESPLLSLIHISCRKPADPPARQTRHCGAPCPPSSHSGRTGAGTLPTRR